MDQWRKDIFFRNVILLLIAFILSCNAAMGNVVFGVQHVYGGRKNSSASQLKAHDANRHGRALVAVELPLGGDDKVTHAALYYTKLSIGTPPLDYYVQVDTGSDILWVNCAGCDKCPTKSSLGLDLKLYDPKVTTTSNKITCNDTFCQAVYEGEVDNCKPSEPCTYTITYADGSGSQGYFVKDIINFDQITGNLKTSPMNGSISFGCSFGHSGTKDTSTDRVDGIVGFGQMDTSIISQLSFQKKAKRMFSHCLDGGIGGGIFAIGEVITDKNDINTVLQVTPMLADHTHYTVKMKEVEIDGETLTIPTDGLFGRKAVIDSGATLAHFPESVYDLLMQKIFSKKHDIEMYKYSQFNCFRYKGNVDNDFPTVTFHFKGFVSMKSYPHEYLLEIDDKGQWCIGWQKGGMKNDEDEEMILLGDIVLSNKLVVYDLENQTIGWKEYNCSSTIKVKDSVSGDVYSVGAHNISPSSSASRWKQDVITLLMLLVIMVMVVVVL